MVSCILCARTQKKKNENNNITFHRIPLGSVKEKWLDFMQNKCNIHISSIKPKSVVCSSHFDPHCFDRNLNIMKLKPFAVPSIYIKRKKYAKNLYTEKHTSYENETNSLENIAPQSSVKSSIELDKETVKYITAIRYRLPEISLTPVC